MIIIHTVMKGYVLGSTIQDHKQLNFLKFKLMGLGLPLPLPLSLSKNSWLLYNCTTFLSKIIMIHYLLNISFHCLLQRQNYSTARHNHYKFICKNEQLLLQS